MDASIKLNYAAAIYSSITANRPPRYWTMRKRFCPLWRRNNADIP